MHTGPVSLVRAISFSGCRSGLIVISFYRNSHADAPGSAFSNEKEEGDEKEEE